VTIAWLKALHISALAIWCAGLLYLPGLLLSHARVADRRSFIRLRHLTRFAYTAVASPAAVVAIGSGTALILLAGVLTGWMFLKLAVVGLMMMVHLQYGQVMGLLAIPAERPPRARLLALTGGVLVLIPLVLWLVLAKPVIDTGLLPDWLHRPLALQSPSSVTMPI
jgi:putative membrane protein